jgi:outer membrane immunogenic protein
MKNVFCVSLVLWTLPATAADILPFYRAPPIGPVASWTGFYAGLNAGWVGSWNDRVQNSGTGIFGTAVQQGAVPTQVDLNRDGFIGGAQAGFNWQFAPNWVAGAEADFQGASAKTSADFAFPGNAILPPITTSYSTELTSIGTVRARLGYLSSATLLWYATGGLAYGQIKFGTAAACSLLVPPCSQTSVSLSTTKTGWTFGGGVEWQLAPAWTLRAEYLYVDLGMLTNTFAYNGTGSLTSQIKESDNIVRAGFTYKLY